jgi:magnesium-transporting ATPase (P-type)
MVVGISEFAESVADNADVFVTFSPIASTLSGYLDEEIKILDTNGASTGASCEQKTKGKADMMITRPTAEKGGLNTLLRSFGFSQWARQNMNGFARFSVAMLVLRIFIMIVPMLFGNIMLDARHLLFFMTFFDIPAFLTYALNTNIKHTNEIFIKDKLSFKEYIIKERNLIIAMGISAVLLYLLPHIPDVLGMKYFYSTEYYFVASIWLHFFAWYFIYYRKANKTMIKELLKNRIMLVAFAVILIITVALFIIEPFGLVLGLDRNPIVFLLIGFVPPIAFTLTFILLGKGKDNKTDKIVNNL